MTHDRERPPRSGEQRVEYMPSVALPFWERVRYWPKPWGGGLYAAEVEPIVQEASRG